MKKLLALLLCVLLLGISPAMAEKSEPLPLFRLTVKDAAGQEKTIGSAVLFSGEDLMTTVPVTNPDGITAYDPNGSAYAITDVMSSAYGYAYLGLDRVVEDFLAFDISFEGIADSRLVGLTANGQRYEGPAKSVTAATYRGIDAYLVSADEPLMPGAVLVDERNDLIGLVMATWGEGENRYVAAREIDLLLMQLGELDQETVPEADVDWLTGMTLDYREGVLTVDWSGCELSGLDGDSSFIVYVQDIGNEGLYYSYYLADAPETSKEIALAPGRSYAIWVSHVHGEDAEPMLSYDAPATTFTAPDEGMLTDYGFTDDCYIGWTPNGEDPNEAVSLMETPRELIEMRAHEEPFYLRVANTYHVEEDIEQSMIVALQTPEGYLIASVNGYIFSPEYEENDVWSVEINELFDTYIEYGTGGYAEGEYKVRYAIGGVWAGECAFTFD